MLTGSPLLFSLDKFCLFLDLTAVERPVRDRLLPIITSLYLLSNVEVKRKVFRRGYVPIFRISERGKVLLRLFYL